MQIGEAAQASGVSAKMIRHYETIALIPSADRRSSNYRSYAAEDVHRLKFIRRARDLGFSIDRIRDLLALWSDRNRCSSEVKAIALAHVGELEAKITHMREMAGMLHELADACEGNNRPDCPIIRDLEGTLTRSAVAKDISRKRSSPRVRPQDQARPSSDRHPPAPSGSGASTPAMRAARPQTPA